MAFRKATPDHEAFFEAMCDAMKSHCDAHPELRNIEVIAILGRLAGYCIAMCYPDERDLARATAVTNMDKGTADVASGGPPTAGRA